jgi:hypothetical protein
MTFIQSFQSSTNVLDTSSTNTLFNGTLGIIIKVNSFSFLLAGSHTDSSFRMLLTQTQKRSSTSTSFLSADRKWAPSSCINRFHQKFQRIVEQEKGDNFISKLHKGKFDIIPWPVIESARFYDLFGALKIRLDRQPLTYKHAGVFIGALKMLMAQLKVCQSPFTGSNI